MLRHCHVTYHSKSTIIAAFHQRQPPMVLIHEYVIDLQSASTDSSFYACTLVAKIPTCQYCNALCNSIAVADNAMSHPGKDDHDNPSVGRGEKKKKVDRGYPNPGCHLPYAYAQMIVATPPDL